MAHQIKWKQCKKVSETLNKQSNPAEEMERMAPNKEHFQSLIESTNLLNPLLSNVSIQKLLRLKMFKALKQSPLLRMTTYLSKKRISHRPRRKDVDVKQKTEEVEGVAATGSKKIRRVQNL